MTISFRWRCRRHLIAFAAILSGVIVLPARSGDLKPGGDASALAAALGLPSLDDLEATRERPLFSPSRKPPPRGLILAAEPDEDAPVREETPPFALAGVVLSQGMRMAMLRQPNDKLEIARQGQDFGGWRIEAVGPREVLVSRGGSRVKLQIFESKRK